MTPRGTAMANSPLPPQKPHTCPHCRWENWLPVHPDPIAPVSACILFNCEKCGKTFKHVVGSGLTLFLVRCACSLAALPPLLAVLWFVAALYCLYLVAHLFGFVALALLLLACGACLSLRHEGLKEIPAALWLFAGAVAQARFVIIYLLHQPENAAAVSGLALLVVSLAAWFGAPPAPYEPLRWYDGDRHGSAPPAGLPQPDDIEAAGL